MSQFCVARRVLEISLTGWSLDGELPVQWWCFDLLRSPACESSFDFLSVVRLLLFAK